MKKHSTQDLWIRVILFFAICVILIFSFQGFILGLIETLFFERGYIRDNRFLAINIIRAMNGIVGIGLVYVFLSFDRQKIVSTGFSWNKKFGWEWIILSIPITIAGLIPTLMIEFFLPEIIGLEEPIVVAGGLLDPFGILVSLCIAFFAFGIGEEILFRGYLQTIMETKYSFYFSAAVSAFLFGYLHFLLLTPTSDLISMFAILFSAFAMGLTFSYAFKITNYNLTFAIAIHGVWDFILFSFQAEFSYNTVTHAIIEIFASVVGATIIFILIYLYSTTRLSNVMIEEDQPFKAD